MSVERLVIFYHRVGLLAFSLNIEQNEKGRGEMTAGAQTAYRALDERTVHTINEGTRSRKRYERVHGSEEDTQELA
jgi:hypothetical protein